MRLTVTVCAIAALVFSNGCVPPPDDGGTSEPPVVPSDAGPADDATDEDVDAGTPVAPSLPEAGGEDAGGGDAGTRGLPTDPMMPSCNEPVDPFPTPVSDATTLMTEVDDGYMEARFADGFEFPFYGERYDRAFINSNGGIAFDDSYVEDLEAYDPAADSVWVPSIAVFWGDMDAGDPGARERAEQLTFQSCTDRFVIRYERLQDFDEEYDDNSATVTLFADGVIRIEYGLVGSHEILVGIFDGTHVEDSYLAPRPFYDDYAAYGSGIILFDEHGDGPRHRDELDDRTIELRP